MSVKVTLDMRQLEHDDWQQGSLLPVELVTQFDFDPAHLYVIITHSCDLLSNDLTLEPFVTVLEGHRVSSPEEQKALEKGEFVGLRHPRKLHLGHDEQHYAFVWAHKHERPRERLLGHQPAGQLNPASLPTLQRFIARKFNRPALASEFENRLRFVKRTLDPDTATARKETNREHRLRREAFQTALEATRDTLERIYMSNQVLEFCWPWDEKPTEANTYTLDVIGILKPGADDRTAMRALQAWCAEIAKCPGITLEDAPDVQDENTALRSSTSRPLGSWRPAIPLDSGCCTASVSRLRSH